MSRAGWVVPLKLRMPSLEDNSADGDRLIRHLAESLPVSDLRLDFDLLPTLPTLLRDHGYETKVVWVQDGRRGQVIHLEPRCESQVLAGLAIDLGTTRMVLRLLDLETGANLGERTVDNPQLAIGPDILTRIHYTQSTSRRDRLSEMVAAEINRCARQLCQKAGISVQRVFLAALAGNTAMTHLFLGLDPKWMIREPYIPVINRPGILPAGRVGLAFNPRARLMVFPNIGAYFGGDVVAGILATGLHHHSSPCLLVDVGTNAEVVLGERNWMMACAGAAGPALEGGVARMGMMAGPGVVERVRIDPQSHQFTLTTIEDQVPKGICGSGVIDLAAQLFRAGMIDIRGKLVPSVCGERYTEKEDLGHVIVVPAAESATGNDLTFSQADLDSLIRSKAAMYSILRTLTLTVGISFEEIERIFVAGTFGAYIDPESAITIGMIPDLPLERYAVAGNTSLAGAALWLTAFEAAAQVDDIRDRLTYMELNVNQQFMNRFSAAKFIPHTDRHRFPSVMVP